MSYINILKEKYFSTRIALFVALLLGNTGWVMADNTVSIADFEIKAGEEKEIAIELSNTDADLYFVDGYIEMPEGLQAIEFTKNVSAKTTSRTNAFMVGYTFSTKLFRVQGSGMTISGTSGAIATIKVKATTDLAATSEIKLTNFRVRHSDKNYENITATNATVTRTDTTEPDPETPDTPDPETKGIVLFSEPTVTLNGGETVDVDVLLTNEGEFTGFNGHLAVDVEGVSIKNVTKGDRVSGNFKYTAEKGNIVALGSISGTEGALFTVTLEAAKSFSGEATLSFDAIALTTSTSSTIEPDAISLSVSVTAAEPEPEPEVKGAVSFSEATITLNAGETADVDVLLTNEGEFTGFNGHLAVDIEGVSIKNVTKGERVSGNFKYTAEKGNIVALGSISGTEGALFTVTLEAAESFSGEAKLSFDAIALTTSTSSTIEPDAISLPITVSKADDGTKAAADKMIDDVQKELDDAKKEIAEKYPDVAADYDEEATDIQKEIDGLQGDVDKEFADNSTVDTEAVKTKTDAISKEIDDMKESAAQAQEAADKKKANDEAYKKLSDELKALQKQLDDANTEIANDYPDAAADESIQAEAAAIQKKIDDARTALEAKNKKGELTAESKNEGTESVPADIAQLLKDAKAAQAAADELKDEEAKKKANEDAYKKLSKELDDLQKDLDNAKEEIEFKYPDAADDENILKQEADIQKKIDDARDALENKYKNGELMAASENEGVETVPADIIKLLNDAKAVQDAASDDDPDELYKEWNKALNDLYTEYRSSKSFIAENYPAANADEDIQKREQDIYQEIFDARELVKKLHKKGQLTEESEIADTKAIHEEIVQLLKDAADIQAVADNEIAYQSALEKVEGLQKKLDEAKETIKEDCPDVAADYDDDAAQIQKEIDDLKAFIDEQYEDGKFFIDPGVNTDPINRKIEEMLDNAKKAQEAFTPDVPPTAVNGVKQIDGAVAYYDLNGKRIAKTVKGKVVIVKMADGTLRKQAIK